MSLLYMLILASVGTVLAVFSLNKSKIISAITFILGALVIVGVLGNEYKLDNGYDMIASAVSLGYFMGACLVFQSPKRVKRIIEDIDYQQLEKKLAQERMDGELIRQRFVAAIELSTDGILFYNLLEKSIYGTDRFKEIAHIHSNEFKVRDYENRIHQQDLSTYRNEFSKLNKKNPTFDFRYRILHGNATYIWIRERGKKIFSDKNSMVISFVSPLDLRLFPTTGVELLDSLGGKDELILEIEKLYKYRKDEFALVNICLYNIPDVNDQTSRKVATLMMGNYIKKLKQTFAKDGSSLFRLSGISFAMILHDKRKADVLQKALESGGNTLNLSMTIGGTEQVIRPYFGIAVSPTDSALVQRLLFQADQALKHAISKNSKKNYCYYKDIRR